MGGKGWREAATWGIRRSSPLLRDIISFFPFFFGGKIPQSAVSRIGLVDQAKGSRKFGCFCFFLRFIITSLAMLFSCCSESLGTKYVSYCNVLFIHVYRAKKVAGRDEAPASPVLHFYSFHKV